MSERKKIGPRVDEHLWKRFREAVKDEKGGTKNHVGRELETAMRLYLGNESEVSAVQMNQRLARIEAAVGVAESDGGTSTVSTPEHTRAPSRIDPDERPAANAATEKKVAWLASQLTDEIGDGFKEVPRSELVELVKDEYDFRVDTAKRYVDRLADHFDLQQHPKIDSVLVTPERYEELVEERREELREEASEELE
jgi:hypothetical protein